MSKIRPDIEAALIRLEDVHKHVDDICPPSVRQQILQELYDDYMVAPPSGVTEEKKAG